MNSQHWFHCDSRSDLEARLAARKNAVVLPTIESDDPNSWGFVEIQSDRPIVLPISFANLGLIPEVQLDGGRLFVGIGNIVAGIEISTRFVAFQYRVPSVFHQFIRIDKEGILLQDETGFVLISSGGKELWKFCTDDLIQDFKFVGNVLDVTSFEGERFRVEVGGGVVAKPSDHPSFED